MFAGAQGAGRRRLRAPDDNVFPVDCKSTTKKAQIPVTDWLTAHPDIRAHHDDYDRRRAHAGHDERHAQARQAQGDATSTSPPAPTSSGNKQIKTGHEMASVAFFPEQYGEWLIPMLEDVLAGQPRAELRGPGPVDHHKRRTSKKYYP